MLLAYVHDLDPVLFSLTETLKVRWYGLAYLAGFIAAWWLLKKDGREKPSPCPSRQSLRLSWPMAASSASFWEVVSATSSSTCSPRWPVAAQIAADPLTIIKVWDGGMSSHGGIFGLTVYAWFYARRTKVSWAALGDAIVCVAPLGVFFGRMANYINGELFGHTAKTSLPWLVKFPGALFNRNCPESADASSAMRAAIEASTGQPREALEQAYATGFGGEQALTAAIRSSDSVKAAVEPFLLNRHPSQVYEGLLEGLLLFILLTTLRFRYPKLPTGLLTGLFFLLYALGRIFVEQFRVPDSAMVGIFTKGQFYSLFFIIIGVAFLLWSLRKKPPAAAISS